MRRCSTIVFALVACAVPEGELDVPDDDAGSGDSGPTYEEVVEAADAERDPKDEYMRTLARDEAWAQQLDGPLGESQRRAQRKRTRKIRRWCRKGQRLAETEVRAGELGWLGYGDASGCYYEYSRAAHERLGVRMSGYGCVVDAKVRAITSCYNIVMDREIEARHGPGALKAIREETCPD